MKTQVIKIASRLKTNQEPQKDRKLWKTYHNEMPALSVPGAKSLFFMLISPLQQNPYSETCQRQHRKKKSTTQALLAILKHISKLNISKLIQQPFK